MSSMKQGWGLRAACIASWASLVACGVPPEDFAIADENDPVVKAVKRQALNTSASVSVTIRNTSGYALTEGLLTLSPTFTVNTAPSTALYNFVHENLPTTGNAAAFATALGLTVGTNAFVVPAMSSGASASVQITVPATATLSYLGRVTVSIDDFLAASNITLTNGAPGTVTVALKGYDLQNTSNVITLGNGTTGENPPSTTVGVLDTSDCPSGVLTTTQVLVSETFNAGAGSNVWPLGFGWDGEFGGDWYTDGITARVYNPNWGGADPSAPIPTVTGFWKRIDLCPGASSKLQFTAKVTSTYTDATSDATLVLYFFDRGGNVLTTASNHPMFGKNDRNLAVYDVAIPASTRQIAVAPMARLGATELGDLFYDNLSVAYEPASAYTTTTLATDDFSRSTNGASGGNQPSGWAEFGGDWYRMKADNWATLGNPAWAGQPAGVDTGLTKTFNLTGLQAGDLLNVRIFAAATFTDETSFVRLRAVFNNSPVALESDRQVRGYGFVDLRRQAIPAGATSVTVIVNAYLGPAETSSLYVDDFSLARTHPN